MAAETCRDRGTPPDAGTQQLHTMRTLLVADDCEIIRHALSKSLAALGYRTLVASDGLEAIRALKSADGACDAILLDIDMPHMNGIEVAKKVREIWPNTAILFVTASEQDSVRRRLPPGFKAGYLQKPFRLAVLASELNHMLPDPTAESETTATPAIGLLVAR